MLCLLLYREYLSDNGNVLFTSYPARVNNNGNLIYMLYATFLAILLFSGMDLYSIELNECSYTYTYT
jgi:hypothetical protein